MAKKVKAEFLCPGTNEYVSRCDSVLVFGDFMPHCSQPPKLTRDDIHRNMTHRENIATRVTFRASTGETVKHYYSTIHGHGFAELWFIKVIAANQGELVMLCDLPVTDDESQPIGHVEPDGTVFYIDGNPATKDTN